MENVCQSCAMIMGKDETMEEMIESCIPFWINDSDCKTADDARNKMMKIFPNLKRWKSKII